ncbi:hypothetical protein [Photobacterium galatheae]|uniref:DUF1963 domain-containing protein n=1 Tax=Photobacterium galatheae TaxID=1654360 RepID=A0A066RTW4_9GAMM|nr:hypothetical protein [Photobacterium galatheae]KDM91122.1 hypothetical protein EA58_13300 [Photobacterium galatheae]MCM0150157.1 hypothetical protein [Photobacterium galatheae]
MGLYIKDSAFTCPQTRILKATEFYKPFPTNEDVAFNQDQLLPIGLLAYSQIDKQSDNKVLIALPVSMAIFDGDVPFMTYSLTESGWQVDAHDAEHIDEDLEDFEDYGEFYERAAAFYAKYQRLSLSLEEESESVELLQIGGQPILGCNWDAYLWDEARDDEDKYFDALDEESGANYDDYMSREIGFYDEESELDFVYLGTFSYTTYVDGGGECILFYNAQHQKVMAISEFS